MKVLIVDDSKAARMLISSLIRNYSRDITLLEAENGKIGVEIHEEEHPDLTFMDLTMPVMDGYEALAEIKKRDPSARVIVLTADIQARAVEKCLNLGALRILKKLPKEEDVHAMLDTLFKKEEKT